jgi:hypothetical protein
MTDVSEESMGSSHHNLHGNSDNYHDETDSEAMWGYAAEPEHHEVNRALEAAEETRALRAAHDRAIPRLNDAEAVTESPGEPVLEFAHEFAPEYVSEYRPEYKSEESANPPLLHAAISEALASWQAPTNRPPEDTASVAVGKAKGSPKRLMAVAGVGILAAVIGFGGWAAVSSPSLPIPTLLPSVQPTVADPLPSLPEAAPAPSVEPTAPENDFIEAPSTLAPATAPPLEPDVFAEGDVAGDADVAPDLFNEPASLPDPAVVQFVPSGAATS